VERYLTGNSVEETARLDTARHVADAIWDEHEATVLGDTTGARAALTSALALEPNNAYLRYLDRKEVEAVREALRRQ
jgi:hypothetical protein